MNRFLALSVVLALPARAMAHFVNDRRPEPRCRRPLVEALEGRQVLSGFAAPHVDMIVGQHIGTNVAAIQGQHIGVSVDAIQGSHIGSNVAAVQGAHIG
jgi:hypothetical protein